MGEAKAVPAGHVADHRMALAGRSRGLRGKNVYGFPGTKEAAKHRASDHRLAISDHEIDAAGDAIARIDNGGSVEPRLGANQGLNAQDRLMRSSRLPQRQIHRKTGRQSGQGGEDRSGDLREGQGVYFDSLTVVFGWLLPYFLVTYRPETADRYLPDDDEPRRARPLPFAAMCFDSFPGLGSAPARPTFGRARK